MRSLRIFQQCSNAHGWQVVSVQSASEPDTDHQVAVSDWGEYVCDCKGFLFRGTCHHRAEAEANRCRWAEGQLPSQSVGERESKRCPNCGSHTILVAEVEDGDGS